MTQEISLDELRQRANRPHSAIPRPFLRWAGSKRYVLEHIVDVLPKHYNTYFEPFLGSAALFFLLQPSRAVLSDTAAELVATYRALRENVNTIINYLSPLKPRKRLYYQIRDKRSAGRLKRAAEFIYLNKTCWNGLYRVNAKGEFNVPFGAPQSDFIADPQNLRACVSALSLTDISLDVCDFEESVQKCKPGDLVYFDPPYITGHSNNGFVEYNETIFSWKDQIRLATVARGLADNGVHVIVSSADHQQVLELYRDFSVNRFERNSTLAGDSSKRRRVSEVLLCSVD